MDMRTIPTHCRYAMRFITLIWPALCLTSSLGFAAEVQGGYIYGGDKYIGDIDTDDMGDLARAVQNPIADLISVPFQNNTNFDFGPREKTQNVMNIQPVVPFDLNDEAGIEIAGHAATAAALSPINSSAVAA